ncbi:putative MFS transporter [Aspergillus novofumigatus IBT 16806]|uniref:Putative MFS transporter n=1 Tax=Aspergillus novofumigatus (strain IBT 16806) TaxID=1392255 RepID=A0A2I1C6T3_ASPN1|nr:putative MFS transporter [Aspergillus novofumigatus IBT 16806]PKX93296.1 putative MFS transporter [Aspergillus novofumigatus IBT 16806]
MSEPKPHSSVEDARDVEIASDDFDEQHFDASYRSPQEKALVWKQDLHIVPLCAAIYLLCYLDRSNIGNAKILNQDTHNDLLSETKMTSYQYTIALMVFLIAYALFEVPSNYFLKKLRPSRWVAFLMLSWGACTMGLGGTHNFAQVTGLRFLLGVMEAGLFPGLVYYLTFWYRHSERSMRVALILASATLAGAFGGAIAYGVGHINQVHALSAWRWLFIIEGAPSCASAVLVWFFLPDYPESARWLTQEERDLAAQRLRTEGSQGEAKAMTWEDAKAVLTDWRLYAHYAVYFGISAPFSSLSLFTPAITSGLGAPWAVAYVVTTAAAWSADHFNSRGLHSALFSFIAPLRLPHRRHQRRLRLHPPLLGWLSSNLRSTAGTGLAIALNVSFGAPGQIVGVWIYKAKEAKRGYPTGHWTNAGLLLFVCAGCIMLRCYYGWLNRRDRASGKRFAY